MTFPTLLILKQYLLFHFLIRALHSFTAVLRSAPLDIAKGLSQFLHLLLLILDLTQQHLVLGVNLLLALLQYGLGLRGGKEDVYLLYIGMHRFVLLQRRAVVP